MGHESKTTIILLLLALLVCAPVQAKIEEHMPTPQGWKCLHNERNPDGWYELYGCVKSDAKTGKTIDRPHICTMKNFIWPSDEEYYFYCDDGRFDK